MLVGLDGELWKGAEGCEEVTVAGLDQIGW